MNNNSENIMNKPKLTIVKNTVVFIICLIIATCVCKELLKKNLTYNVPVSYDIKFEGFNGKNVNLDVFYTLDSNKNFSEKQKIRKVLPNIPNNEWQTVSVNIPTQRKEKINLIRIDMGDYPNSQFRPSRIFIKNIMVKGKEITSLQSPKDLALNHAKQDTITNETADEISFKIENRDPFLIFKKPFNLRGAWFSGLFDNSISNSQLILFCIATSLLTFLLFLAVSKILLIQQNNKISYANVALIILVAVTMLIPASKIEYQSTKSETENRMLAVYKPIVQNNAINETYGKDFESWFNDRFTFRNLITLDIKNIYPLLGIKANTSNTIVGNSYILFYTGDKSLEQITGKYKQPKVSTLKKDIISFLEKHHPSKLTFLITPMKMSVMPHKIGIIRNPYITDYNENFNIDLDKTYNINVLYPLKALTSNKNSYFKHDTHVSRTGACLVAHVFLQNQPQKDHHRLCESFKPTSNVRRGDLDRFTFNVYFNEKYNIDYHTESEIFYEIEDGVQCQKLTPNIVHCRSTATDTKLRGQQIIAIGDSQLNRTEQFKYIAKYYKESYIVYTNGLKKWDSIPECYDCEILLESTERRFLGLFKRILNNY